VTVTSLKTQVEIMLWRCVEPSEPLLSIAVNHLVGGHKEVRWND
jgi:hypothetical protein